MTINYGSKTLTIKHKSKQKALELDGSIEIYWCLAQGFFSINKVKYMKSHTFDVDIAIKYGIIEATLLSHIKFWIEKNIANNKNYYDNNYWTYNSIKAFKELFPYLSEKQIRYALKKLEQMQVIKTANYNKSKYDRTNWYAIIDKSILQYGKIHLTKSTNGSDTEGEPIPDINTDIKPNINIVGVSTNDEKGINKRLKGYQQMIKDNNTKNNTYNISYVEELAKGNNTKELEDKFSISKRDVITVAEYMIDWKESTGKSYKNYKSAMFNWIRNKLQEGKIKKIEKVYQEHDIDYDNYKPE